jgi:hypothetical protein
MIKKEVPFFCDDVERFLFWADAERVFILIWCKNNPFLQHYKTEPLSTSSQNRTPFYIITKGNPFLFHYKMKPLTSSSQNRSYFYITK